MASRTTATSIRAAIALLSAAIAAESSPAGEFHPVPQGGTRGFDSGRDRGRAGVAMKDREHLMYALHVLDKPDARRKLF